MNFDFSTPGLPSPLLLGISEKGGGRVVLVLGAGCSKEPPTDLPLGSELSESSLRRLIQDGVLNEGDVANGRDLSAVADAVFQKKGSQRELTERFPQDAFRHAEPNEGYLNMAALLLEGAISDAMTLNFDFAGRNALAVLGAREAVSTIRGPQDYGHLGTRNLIFLHRDIDSPPDELVLRTRQLDEEWWNNWEEVIAQRVLASPVVVFVGLGSPAAVLLETSKRIAKALNRPQANLYIVDPSEYGNSAFANMMQIGPQDYLRMGWCDFMRELSQRLVEEHRVAIVSTCDLLSNEMQIATEDVTELSQRLSKIGLVGLGRLRAIWMLQEVSYSPFQYGPVLRLFSDLILGVRLVERQIQLEARFGEDGLVEFHGEGYAMRAMVITGGGSRTRPAVEAEANKRYESMRLQGRPPSFALIAGVEPSPYLATPSNIALEADPDDLVSGATDFRILHISEIRSDPSRALETIR